MTRFEYPKFGDALADFKSFCQSEDSAEPYYWICRPRVLADGQHFWIYRPSELLDLEPHQLLFERATKKRANVSIELLGELDGRGVATVNSPRVDLDDHGDSGCVDYKIHTGPPKIFHAVSNPILWSILRFFCSIRRKDNMLRYDRFPD